MYLYVPMSDVSINTILRLKCIWFVMKEIIEVIFQSSVWSYYGFDIVKIENHVSFMISPE